MIYKLEELPNKGLIKDFKDIKIGDSVLFPVHIQFNGNLFKTQIWDALLRCSQIGAKIDWVEKAEEFIYEARFVKK